jgi:putative acetyltransferase
VAPARQRLGVGSALIRSGLRRLAERDVAGCVVLGDPAYYRRFGFGPSGGLRYPGPPADHFMAWAVEGALPAGQVQYHAAFDVEP